MRAAVAGASHAQVVHRSTQSPVARDLHEPHPRLPANIVARGGGSLSRAHRMSISVRPIFGAQSALQISKNAARVSLVCDDCEKAVAIVSRVSLLVTCQDVRFR